jgi:cytochrome b6-f complex iron-sulfur subunit
MAETHKEVVKVWIAPGCIVCDACEADCPEVFDVQEETCVIRPEAKSPDFTKPLTPSIIIAAEGCPVDVIKFETIEVEGPEPWAGKEEQVAETAAVGAGAGGAKKAAGPVIPEGPPDPKWAGLLRSSHTSGARSAGGVAVAMRPAAKAPVEAVASALPRGAPPDAQVATMIGSGYSRPKASVTERIREKAAVLSGAAKVTRREFSVALVVAWGSLLAVAATGLAAFQSFLVPKVTKEPPTTFRAGKLGDYPTDGVYEQFKGAQNVWIVRERGILFALSTICTHLGCIPNWIAADMKFKCPCHGSGFYMNGVHFEGPAPRPLERHKISLEGDLVIVDKSMKYRQELGQWENPASFISV